MTIDGPFGLKPEGKVGEGRAIVHPAMHMVAGAESKSASSCNDETEENCMKVCSISNNIGVRI